MSEKLDPAVPVQLQTIAGAMGLGIVMLAAFVVFTYFQNARVATVEGLRLINLFTALTMGVTVAAIVGSEIAWKTMLARVRADPSGKSLTTAFIIRTACREGAAMLGCVTTLLAAMNGVLRANSVYWADMAPAALFWSYLFLHWPSAANLEAEISGFPRI
ncbi:MAG: hypothetical protein ACHQ51_00775 [Elusimicrobiota bacterium]